MATIRFNAAELRRALEREILDILKEDAAAMVRTVVLATPFGRPELWRNPPPPNYEPGHARLNWQVSVGSPAENEIPGVDKGGTRAISTALTRVAAWSTLRQAAFLQNNAPYIGRLNDGWSTQAPAMFVEKAIQTAQNRDNSIKELP